MSVHTALIVDDERIARSELIYLLREHPDIKIAGEAASVEEAVLRIRSLRPDLIFLDVQMPGGSGFELFDRFEIEAHVIFVTAYDEYALRAFDVNALDYLTKPVRPERLRLAIQRFQQQVMNQATATGLTISDTILLTIDHVRRFVRLDSIDCILAEGDYSRIICNGRPLGIVLKSMKEWESLLPAKHFFRIQRSTIINYEQVARLEPEGAGGYLVYLRNLEKPLTMSRRFARLFKARSGG